MKRIFYGFFNYFLGAEVNRINIQGYLSVITIRLNRETAYDGVYKCLYLKRFNHIIGKAI